MATSQNTRTVTDETLAKVLTRSQRLRLSTVAKATGFSSQKIVRRGVDLFLRQEAPVWEEAYKQAQS